MSIETDIQESKTLIQNTGTFNVDTDSRSVGKAARHYTPSLIISPESRTHQPILHRGFVEAECIINIRCIPEHSKMRELELEKTSPVALPPVIGLLPTHMFSPTDTSTGWSRGSDVGSTQRLREPASLKSGELENRYGQLEGLFTDTVIDAAGI